MPGVMKYFRKKSVIALAKTCLIDASGNPIGSLEVSGPADVRSEVVALGDTWYYAEIDILEDAAAVNIGIIDTVQDYRYAFTNSGGWWSWYNGWANRGPGFAVGDTIGLRIINNMVMAARNGGAFNGSAGYEGATRGRSRVRVTLNSASAKARIRLDPTTFKYPQGGHNSYWK